MEVANGIELAFIACASINGLESRVASSRGGRAGHGPVQCRNQASCCFFTEVDRRISRLARLAASMTRTVPAPVRRGGRSIGRFPICAAPTYFRRAAIAGELGRRERSEGIEIGDTETGFEVALTSQAVEARGRAGVAARTRRRSTWRRPRHPAPRRRRSVGRRQPHHLAAEVRTRASPTSISPVDRSSDASANSLIMVATRDRVVTMTEQRRQIVRRACVQ